MSLPSQTVWPSGAAPATPAGCDARFVESLNPVTLEVIAQFQKAQPALIPQQVARARTAQTEWGARPVRERCVALRRLRDAIYQRRHEIADVITRETGKPRVEAVFAEVMLALDIAGYFASMAPAWLRPQRVAHHNFALKAKRGYLTFEPYGVLAVISPWNYPFSIPIAEIVPALAVGNAVLLKPSELTPWCGALLGELAARSGFPDGLVQVLHGGGDVGAALVNAGPDKVFFTGSVETGRKIAEACARQLIPSVLELGGKDAMIVLADANLEVASSAAVWGGMTNCGQACLSVERIYAEQSIAERFTELCVAKTTKLRLGLPGDADAEVGPMIRERQTVRVEEQLRDAVARGARILTGGRRRADLGPSFFEPTVVVDVEHSMSLMRDETFGPVLAIRAVADAEEAVALANDSVFGLAASVWTRDTGRGRQIAAQLHAGSVMVNDVASYYGICEAPHGGRGASGWGRAHSRLGFMEMVQAKYVDVDQLPNQPKSWWYGYHEPLGRAADRFVDFTFARDWKSRMAALFARDGAWRALFRGHRI